MYNANEKRPTRNRPRVHNCRITGRCIDVHVYWLVAAYVGLIGGALAIILGIVGIVRTSKANRNLRGLGFGVASLILGLLLVIITLVVFAMLGAF